MDGKGADAMGYIRDKLDVKMLILYLMARIGEPINFDTLAELVTSHDVDYFLYTEAVSELVESAHLSLCGEFYSITQKGKDNSAACETSLPLSVRRRCCRDVGRMNAARRRDAQVRGEAWDNPDGSVTAQIALDDDRGNLLTLELLCPSQEQARLLLATFQERPEQVYNHILDIFFTPEKEEKREC